MSSVCVPALWADLAHWWLNDSFLLDNFTWICNAWKRHKYSCFWTCWEGIFLSFIYSEGLGVPFKRSWAYTGLCWLDWLRTGSTGNKASWIIRKALDRVEQSLCAHILNYENAFHDELVWIYSGLESQGPVNVCQMAGCLPVCRNVPKHVKNRKDIIIQSNLSKISLQYPRLGNSPYDRSSWMTNEA